MRPLMKYWICVNLLLKHYQLILQNLQMRGHLSWIEIQKKQNDEIVFRVNDKFAEGIKASR